MKNNNFAKIIALSLFAFAPVFAAAQTVRYVTYFPTPHAYYTQLAVSETALLATRGIREGSMPNATSFNHAVSGVVEVGSQGQSGAKLEATVAPVIDPVPPGLNVYSNPNYYNFYNLTLRARTATQATMQSLRVGYTPLNSGMLAMVPLTIQGVFGTGGDTLFIAEGPANAFGPKPQSAGSAPLSNFDMSNHLSGLQDFTLIADGTLRVTNLTWGVGESNHSDVNNTVNTQNLMGGIGIGYIAYSSYLPTKAFADSFSGNAYVTGSTGLGGGPLNACIISPPLDKEKVLKWQTLRIKNTKEFRTYLTCEDRTLAGTLTP